MEALRFFGYPQNYVAYTVLSTAVWVRRMKDSRLAAHRTRFRGPLLARCVQSHRSYRRAFAIAAVVAAAAVATDAQMWHGMTASRTIDPRVEYVVEGRASTIAEDYFLEQRHEHVVVIRPSDGGPLLVARGVGTDELFENTPVTWLVRNDTHEPAHRQLGGAPTAPAAGPTASYGPRSVSVVDYTLSPEAPSRRSAAARRRSLVALPSTPIPLIIVRLGLRIGANGTEMWPLWCNETCAWEFVLTSPTSVAAQMSDSSSGFTYDAGASVVYSVQTNVRCDGCVLVTAWSFFGAAHRDSVKFSALRT